MPTPNPSGVEKGKKSDPKRKPVSTTIRRAFEFASFAVAILGCVSVISVDFYIGLGIMDVGTLMLVIALLYEEKHSIRLAVMPLLLLVGYLNYSLLRPCPISLMAMLLPIANSSGLPPSVGYRRDITYLRVGILNDTDDSLSDVDITLKPDVPIEAIGAYSDVQTNCTLHGDATKERIAIGHVQIYSPTIERNDVNGGKTMIAAKQLSVPEYRIVCSQIIKRSSVDFIVAVGTLNQKATTGIAFFSRAKSSDGEDLGTLWFGSKDQPSSAFVYEKDTPQKISIDAKYVAHFKRFVVRETRTVTQP